MFIWSESAAQVGLDTDMPEAALDISSTDSGLLIPRIALVDLKSAAPVVNPNGGNLVPGTMVWNTATSSVKPSGFYFWENNKWNRVDSNDQPPVYFGKFLITASGTLNVSNLPFQPRSIEFMAVNRVQDFNDGASRSSDNNSNDIRMAGGQTMGYAQTNGAVINQQVISNGFNGSSINNIGAYSSDNHCIAAFFVNNNGDPIRDNGNGAGGGAGANQQDGLIRASLQSFNANGFTINVDKFLSGTSFRSNQIVVIYKAYR